MDWFGSDFHFVCPLDLNCRHLLIYVKLQLHRYNLQLLAYWTSFLYREPILFDTKKKYFKAQIKLRLRFFFVRWSFSEGFKILTKFCNSLSTCFINRNELTGLPTNFSAFKLVWFAIFLNSFTILLSFKRKLKESLKQMPILQ